MLRFKFLASTIPLILAGVLARGELVPSARPCITVGETTVQIAPGPWQPGLKVSFTSDPSLPTVRGQIVDAAHAADFAVVDDIDSVAPNACEGTSGTRTVSIDA